MRLHEDKEALRAILLRVFARSGIRQDILEKDYYVTLMLKELAAKQQRLPAYFKGGTALYKAIGKPQRFSEDIDLTVKIDDCSRTQGKKRLEEAANGYASLPCDKEAADSENKKGAITSVYRYDSVVPVATDDALQRFGRVKVEATSFTVSEPTAPMLVAPLLWDFADNGERNILKESYEVGPFDIETIKVERIFVDKVFAAEFYYERGKLFDAAKHMYDLCVLMDDPRIACLASSRESFEEVARFKRMEELERIGSNQADAFPGDFAYLSMSPGDSALEAFGRMQEIYVLDKAYTIESTVLLDRLNALRELFNRWR